MMKRGSWRLLDATPGCVNHNHDVTLKRASRRHCLTTYAKKRAFKPPEGDPAELPAFEVPSVKRSEHRPSAFRQSRLSDEERRSSLKRAQRELSAASAAERTRFIDPGLKVTAVTSPTTPRRGQPAAPPQRHILLIDGYNAIFRHPELTKRANLELQFGRAELDGWVEAWASATNSRVVVVYDARGPFKHPFFPGYRAGHEASPDTETISDLAKRVFVTATDADTYIIQTVRQLCRGAAASAHGQGVGGGGFQEAVHVSVLSEDNDVIDGAMAAGATIVDARRALDIMRAASEGDRVTAARSGGTSRYSQGNRIVLRPPQDVTAIDLGGRTTRGDPPSLLRPSPDPSSSTSSSFSYDTTSSAGGTDELQEQVRRIIAEAAAAEEFSSPPTSPALPTTRVVEKPAADGPMGGRPDNPGDHAQAAAATVGGGGVDVSALLRARLPEIDALLGRKGGASLMDDLLW